MSGVSILSITLVTENMGKLHPEVLWSHELLGSHFAPIVILILQVGYNLFIMIF